VISDDLVAQLPIDVTDIVCRRIGELEQISGLEVQRLARVGIGRTISPVVAIVAI
jgi:hypothetical protein